LTHDPVEKPRLRVPLTELSPGTRQLDADAAHYAARVHRLRVGDCFVAFDPAARLEADARVVESGRRRVTCELSEPRASTKVSDLDVTLLQALGRGEKFESVVAAATALGVTRLVAVHTERALVRDSPAGNRRWSKAAVEAARQSGRGDLPEIAGPVALGAALEQVGDRSTRLCLHPSGAGRLADALDAWSGTTPIALLIGPEGGLSPSEVEQADRAGFTAVAFGRFVLRTELAAVAVLGAVVARAGQTRSRA
jgi:16S rRNA (uracil1498-N3)-methyltransferase